VGVRELLVVHPADRRVELFRAVDGRLPSVSADAEGSLTCDLLGVRFATAAGAARALGRRLRRPVTSPHPRTASLHGHRAALPPNG
jgi:hypothetical protein